MRSLHPAVALVILLGLGVSPQAVATQGTTTQGTTTQGTQSGAASGVPAADDLIISVRPSSDNDPGMTIVPSAAGSYAARKVQVIALLTSAYGLSPGRVIGAPAWPDRFDVQVKYEPRAAGAPLPSIPALLQALLRDRFALRAHIERREQPVYLLKVARADGRLGPTLTRSALDCSAADATSRGQQQNARAANGAPACGANEGPGVLVAGGMTMAVIARALRPAAGRDVVDATGLSGTWELALDFAPTPDAAGDKPSLFTALQEQAGLRLEAGTAPLDVLVVESVARPTTN